MNKKIKKAWLKALRSDDYEQGVGQLCYTENDGIDHFCCLGVLIDVAADGDWYNYIDRSTDIFWYFQDDYDMPPETFLEEIGLSENLAKELARDNDNGVSFKKIALKIEKRA